MDNKQWEPGLLQVFRWYAILRAVLLLLAAARYFFGPPEPGFQTFQFDPSPVLWLVVLEMVLLLGALYWTKLAHRLGQANRHWSSSWRRCRSSLRSI